MCRFAWVKRTFVPKTLPRILISCFIRYSSPTTALDFFELWSSIMQFLQRTHAGSWERTCRCLNVLMQTYHKSLQNKRIYIHKTIKHMPIYTTSAAHHTPIHHDKTQYLTTTYDSTSPQCTPKHYHNTVNPHKYITSTHTSISPHAIYIKTSP